MAHEPEISVVIPSYQQSAYIDEAVVSVLSQDAASLELVIADHSSTDGTWKRLQSYRDDPRVRLLRTPAGGGASRNWNAATEAARGRYVKLLPGDDSLRPGVLRRQASILASHPEAVLTAGRRDVVDGSGRTLLKGRGLAGLSRPLPGAAAIRATVRAGTNLFGEPGAVMMRRSSLLQAGLWDATDPYAIDVATYIRVLEHGGFVPDTEVASTFRLSSGQWSVKLAREQAAQMRHLHDTVSDRLPDVVSSRDAARGNRRARWHARQRRLVYALLKGLMS